jgi:hypothetical protein
MRRLSALGFDDDDDDEDDEDEDPSSLQQSTLTMFSSSVGKAKIQKILSPTKQSRWGPNMRGLLFTKQDDFMRSWKERYWLFDAETNFLTEFENDRMEEALSSHNVLTVHSIPQRSGKRENRFDLAVDGQQGAVLSLYANNAGEKSSWLTALGASMRKRDQVEQVGRRLTKTIMRITAAPPRSA